MDISKPNVINLTWIDLEKRAEDVAVQIIKNADPREIRFLLYGVPNGGIAPALLVKKALDQKTDQPMTDVVETVEESNIIIDDIIDSGATRQRFREKAQDRPFYALVVKTDPGQWISFPWERMKKEEGPEDNITRILQFIGEDPTREGLKETPKRVIKSWQKLFSGYGQNTAEICKTFSEGACDELVVLKDIEFYSTCEHHMLPFFGKAHIGYLPNKKILGISKLARLLEIYARRLQIQERIGDQITTTLMMLLEPKGCGCVLEAQHFCMTSRGVEKQDSIMVTSSMKGLFLSNVNLRNEFRGMINK